MTLLRNAWLIPAIPAASFVVILLFGKRLPRKGSEVGILALLVSWILATACAIQWIRLPVDHESHLRQPAERGYMWFQNGDIKIGVTSSHEELAAVTPSDGTVRWSLGRPDVSLPRWGGTRTDTRISYFSGGSLRVVAGDGTGDRLLARRVTRVAPVWQPERHVVAFVARSGVVVVRNVDSGAVVVRHPVAGVVRSLAWSADGARLAVATSRGVHVFGRKAVTLPLRDVRVVAFARSDELALLTPQALLVYGPEGMQTVLRVQTRLAGVAWSPDGRWLVTSLPRADQWVFVGRGRVLAVSHITRQFGGAAPSLDGWLPGA